MDVQAILAEVDRDGDGHIDYDEFVAMMMKVRVSGVLPPSSLPLGIATLRGTCQPSSPALPKYAHMLRLMRTRNAWLPAPVVY